MKRFHISIAVDDFAASVADYSRHLGEPPCVVREGRYALWRTLQLNFSISCKPGQAAGVVRHIGFEDDAAEGFTEEQDVNGITWEYFSKDGQAAEIIEKFGADTIVPPRAHAKDVAYRLLTADDIDAFHALLLRSLKEEPHAFLHAHEDVLNWTPEFIARRFGEVQTIGAFIDGELVGFAAFNRYKGKKISHKAMVGPLYVAGKARSRGVAFGMLAMAETLTREVGIELLMLSVNAANPVAVNLYRRAGYEPCGMEPHILKVPGGYVDDILMIKYL